MYQYSFSIEGWRIADYSALVVVLSTCSLSLSQCGCITPEWAEVKAVYCVRVYALCVLQLVNASQQTTTNKYCPVGSDLCNLLIFIVITLAFIFVTSNNRFHSSHTFAMCYSGFITPCNSHKSVKRHPCLIWKVYYIV